MEVIFIGIMFFILVVLSVYNLLFVAIATDGVRNKFYHPVLNIPDTINMILFDSERNIFGKILSWICVIFAIPGIALTCVCEIVYLVYVIFVKIWELGNKK